MVSFTWPLMVGTETEAPSTASFSVTGSVDDHVVAGAAQERMRRDRDLDQRVARRATAHSGPALAFEADGVAVLDPGGDLHVQRAPVRQQHPAGGAVRGLQKSQGQRVAQIGAGARNAEPHRRAALKWREKNSAMSSSVNRPVGACMRPGIPFAAWAAAEVAIEAAARRNLMALGIDLAAIETAAFFRVGQQVVGVIEFREPLRRLLVARMQVGMVPLGEFPVGGLDRRFIRVCASGREFRRDLSWPG